MQETARCSGLAGLGHHKAARRVRAGTLRPQGLGQGCWACKRQAKCSLWRTQRCTLCRSLTKWRSHSHVRPHSLGAVPFILRGPAMAMPARALSIDALIIFRPPKMRCVGAQVSNQSMQLTQPSQSRQAVQQFCLLWLSQAGHRQAGAGTAWCWECWRWGICWEQPVWGSRAA